MAGRKSSSDNTSQRHGIDFENIVKTLWMFHNATNVQRSGIATFDIGRDCDLALGLSTSVKSTGTDSIGLADAARFCAINLPWRMIVGVWSQHGEIKSFHRVHEMIVTLSAMKRIIGEMTEERVLAYHNEIASFASGEKAAAEARRRVAQIKAETEGRTGILRLDFKIDKDDQRRLQASLSLKDLVAILRSMDPYVVRGVAHPLHTVHEDFFHQLVLPLQLRSVKRHIEREDRDRAPDAPGLLIEHVPVPMLPSDDPAPLIRATPVRHDERPRRAAIAADTTQIPLF